MFLTLPQDKTLQGFWRILDENWGVYEGDVTPPDGGAPGDDDSSDGGESDPEHPPVALLAIEDGESGAEAPVESIVEDEPQPPLVADQHMLEGITQDEPMESEAEPMEEPDPVPAAPSTASAAPSPVETFGKETQPQDRRAEILAKLEQLKTGFQNWNGGNVV